MWKYSLIFMYKIIIKNTFMQKILKYLQFAEKEAAQSIIGVVFFLKLLSREYGSMSDRDIPPEYFKSQETILEYTLSFPQKNELMDFLKDKELILLMDYNKSPE